jgi:NRAMP (natural resistance-associated macrophage protein)-like metal ion transporter
MIKNLIKNKSASTKPYHKIKKCFNFLGSPGFITGASDDDPSSVATYSQTGAEFGYLQVWTALFCLPCIIVMQEMSARIGCVTGKGIALIFKEHYPKYLVIFITVLLLFSNIINIAADLSAMAAALRLVIDLPFIFLIFLFSIITLVLEIFITYKKYAKFLKFFSFSLFAYVITAFMIPIDWKAVLAHTFIPTISYEKEYLLNIVAILGATISPYLLIWQPDQEIEEKSTASKKHPTLATDIREIRKDTLIGMFVSCLIMFFIMIVSSATLHANGITKIESLEQAASALKALAGPYTFLLFSIGIIGIGLLTIPILAGSAAYAISEVLGWKRGLSKKPHSALGFYGVILVAVVLGMCLSLSPIKPFQMLYYTAIINGIISTPLMILILLIANNKTIMKKSINNLLSNSLGWFITIMMFVATIAFFISLAL